jgi:hypothetical protein
MLPCARRLFRQQPCHHAPGDAFADAVGELMKKQ